MSPDLLCIFRILQLICRPINNKEGYCQKAVVFYVVGSVYATLHVCFYLVMSHFWRMFPPHPEAELELYLVFLMKSQHWKEEWRNSRVRNDSRSLLNILRRHLISVGRTHSESHLVQEVILHKVNLFNQNTRSDWNICGFHVEKWFYVFNVGYCFFSLSFKMYSWCNLVI